MTRAGFVALAGRPNVGKSTLVNAIVGHKVAIVSDKPQTTRRAIRGVATRPRDWQMVLCDLPGVQRPRDVLTSRMQRRVEQELAECEGTLFVVDGEGEHVGRTLLAAVGEVELGDPLSIDELDRDVGVADAGRRGRQHAGLDDLRLRERGADHVDLEHPMRVGAGDRPGAARAPGAPRARRRPRRSAGPACAGRRPRRRSA